MPMSCKLGRRISRRRARNRSAQLPREAPVAASRGARRMTGRRRPGTPRGQDLSRSADFLSVAMRRICLMASAHSATTNAARVHVLRGLTPENRHRAAQQLGAADGAAVWQQSENGRVVHRLRGAPRLRGYGRHDDARP